MRLAGNGHYKGNGFAVDVLALAMSFDHSNFVATVGILPTRLPGVQQELSYCRGWPTDFVYIGVA